MFFVETQVFPNSRVKDKVNTQWFERKTPGSAIYVVFFRALIPGVSDQLSSKEKEHFGPGSGHTGLRTGSENIVMGAWYLPRQQNDHFWTSRNWSLGRWLLIVLTS